MKTKLKQTNGITLIALIITIIILLILAMVTIRILMNQGIIKHAQNATEAYNNAQNNETEYLTYAEGEMDKYAGGSGSGTDETSGWTDNGDGTFTKDEMMIKVGDYIAYDATKDANGNAVATTSYTSYALANASADKNEGRTNGHRSDYTFNVDNYTSGWRVLGVKNGNVRLISANSVGTLYLQGKEGYRDSEEELNAICAIYGQGKGATSARSINVDDINRITGYDPSKTGDGKPYGDGNIYQYGNDVTYYWKGDTKPYYSGINGIEKSLYFNHNINFNWWEGGEWKTSAKSTTATASAQEKITTLKSTVYWYYPYSLTTDSSTSGEQKGISTSSNEYKVLFGQKYWLASRCIKCDGNAAWYTVRNMGDAGDCVTACELFASQGSTYYPR